MATKADIHGVQFPMLRFINILHTIPPVHIVSRVELIVVEGSPLLRLPRSELATVPNAVS